MAGGSRGGAGALRGQGAGGWRPSGPPAPPAGQPKLDPKIIEQRRQNTASRLRRFLHPLRISPSLAGEEAMAEFSELMQVGLPCPPPTLMLCSAYSSRGTCLIQIAWLSSHNIP